MAVECIENKANLHRKMFLRTEYYKFVYFLANMLNRHVGYYFLPIIPCAGCICTLVASGLRQLEPGCMGFRGFFP